MTVVRTSLVYKVIGALIRVHRRLGPGPLESVYESCVAREFERIGLAFDRQVDVSLIYDGERIGSAFRADFIVEGELLLELKSVDALHPVHHAQVVTYLRLSGLPQALLVNFNVAVLRHGLKSFLAEGSKKK